MSDGANDPEMTAYDGIEDLASFRDRTAVNHYRAALLERTAPHADFLVEHMSPGPVLEIGCGNGRLLIALARRGGHPALGIDIAASRIAFARDWARELRYSRTEFEVGDVREYPFQASGFQTAVCLTGTFAYFEPAAPGAAVLLARRINDALRPGGLFCLELYPHPTYLRLLAAVGGEARIWTELPQNDPWRFYLSRLSLDSTGEILRHDKTFIHRDTGEVDSGRAERLYLYSRDGITQLLERAGFGQVNVYEEWSGKPYSGGEVMVVTAKK